MNSGKSIKDGFGEFYFVTVQLERSVFYDDLRGKMTVFSMESVLPICFGLRCRLAVSAA